jgi:hypothetical protein
MLDLSYLSGEIDLRGDISEPEVPEDTMDLTGVLLKDICGAVIAMPFIICIQLSAMCDCVAKLLLLFKREPRTLEEEAEREEMERNAAENRFNFSEAFASLASLIK